MNRVIKIWKNQIQQAEMMDTIDKKICDFPVHRHEEENQRIC